ncbi:MAG TPA: hypothetical protein VMU84_09310, partial [Thermoanaerobaculia bacterium]|nr:hypothetical protein [Thermoanaerobaculia bacterium]
MRALRPGILAVLAIAAIVGTIRITYQWPLSAGIDFYQFWVGGQEAGRVDDFYSPATRVHVGEQYVQRAHAETSPRLRAVAEFRRDMEWFSTPLQYSFFSIFGGRYDNDLSLFQFLCLIAFVAGFAILAFALRLDWLRALLL